MNPAFLYRALRREEIDADCVLIPKSQEPFPAEARLGIDTRLPFQLGPTEEHAVRQHQWNQHGFPARGVSTTPHIERARVYAHTNKVIVTIDREVLSKHGIKEYVVKKWISALDIAVPEDDEVILVMEKDGSFPCHARDPSPAPSPSLCSGSGPRLRVTQMGNVYEILLRLHHDE